MGGSYGLNDYKRRKSYQSELTPEMISNMTSLEIYNFVRWRKKKNNMKKRTLTIILLLILIILLIGAASLNGYLKGYSNKSLNMDNAKDFCKSRGDEFYLTHQTYPNPEWILCSYSSKEILCGVGSCSNNSDEYAYENPTTKLEYYTKGIK